MSLGRTTHALTWLSISVALAVSLLPPLAYLLIQREGLIHSLEHDARVQAVLVSEVVGRNPLVWRYAHERLVDGIAQVRMDGRHTRILDERGGLVVEVPAPLDWPTLTRSETYYDAGQPAGTIEVSDSLSSKLRNAAWLTLACSLVGLIIFGPLRRMPQRALQRASESLLRGELSRSLVEGLTVGVVLSDFRHHILGANAFARMLSATLTTHGKIGDFLDGACDESDSLLLREDWPMQRCIDTLCPAGPLVIGVNDRDGCRRWLSIKSMPVQHGEGGEYDAVVSSIEDITENKHYADRLNVTQHAVMAAPDSVVITDAESRIVFVNDAFNRLTGYATAEVLGKTPAILRSGRHSNDFYTAMWKLILDEGKWSGEVWNRRRDNGLYPAWLSISAVRDHLGRVVNYIGTHFDLTERMNAEQRVRHLAHHDPLTDLPNRAYLRATLVQALASAERHGWQVAVFFIDLDRFKIVNDTLGHHVGDRVLVEVARRLKQTLREEDTVGRLSGDEFVAFVTGVESDAGLVTIANHLVRAMAVPIVLGDQEVELTVSVGVAIYPQDGRDVDSILSCADTAMYAAKSDGRSNFKFYNGSMDVAGASRLETYSAVRAALEKRQFQLYFQPQVLAVEGFPICGAEALIRWIHPERGMVPPGEFIPVIEESRLIIDVGDWVLAEAIRHARAWREQGRPISISVNVSALQVRQNNFVTKLADIARTHGDIVSLIRLEVTEGLMLDDQEKALAKLQAVKGFGFGLALDDFGTGYSSLAYLAHYPFDELKIDRAFVSGLGIDRAASSIVEAIILLSRALGLQVIAEGVETQSQSAILRKLGCPRIQGYLYGRPMSAQDFTQRLFT